MRIAISGSSGFIGAALSRALQSDGHVVHPIVRRLPRAGEIGLDLERRRLDYSALEHQQMDGIELIYHLAGEPLAGRWTGRKREAIRASRITSTDVIARAMAAMDNPPPVLVTASAVGYYGDRGDEVLTELSTSGRGFLADACRAWETATGPAKAVGVRVVQARSGIVIGHGGGIVATLTPLFRRGLGARLGSGGQWMSYISLADEIEALRFIAARESVVGPCNLTSPTPVTNRDFTKAFARSLHRPALLAVPGSALRLVLGRHAAHDLALASQRVLPQRLTDEGFVFTHPRLEAALAAD